MACQPLLRTAWIVAGVAACVPVTGQSAEPTDDSLWREADARIEQHRRADAVVTVLDRAGKPVAGAAVKIDQTRNAFLFGCNIFNWGRVGEERREAAYRRQFAEVFNFATLPFYWPMYEPQAGRPAHAATEAVARWCQEQGLRCKGHPLAWNYFEPRWLPDDGRKILDLQLARITDCTTRFRGLIDTWDVVNEATHFDREELKKRAPKLTAVWAQTGQIEFTRQCFLRARQAAPRATLLINDYRTDPAYERLIEQLKDAQGQRLYDVIGIQSHQHGGTWNNRRIWDVCQRFARFGVPLHFTETTILSGQPGWERARSGKAWDSTPEGEASQAREVERFYTMLYSHPAVEAITWWDFSDLHAWQSAPAGFLRKDMSPKPAYDVLHKLVKEKWWTTVSGRTDERGAMRWRGTLGEYRITVERPGTPAAEHKLTVARNVRNELTVRLP
jgi:GH35 family endo-1,4-beta-xylanase